MTVFVPLFIVAVFLLGVVYAVTDLDELGREQVLDELWDEVPDGR